MEECILEEMQQLRNQERYLSLKTIIIISRFSFLQFRAPKGNLINTQNK